MSDPFVWFDLRTKDADASRSFYGELLGWDLSDPVAGDGGVRAQVVSSRGRRWCRMEARTSVGSRTSWSPISKPQQGRPKNSGQSCYSQPRKDPPGGTHPFVSPGVPYSRFSRLGNDADW